MFFLKSNKFYLFNDKFYKRQEVFLYKRHSIRFVQNNEAREII